jgi:hypothetical protein
MVDCQVIFRGGDIMKQPRFAALTLLFLPGVVGWFPRPQGAPAQATSTAAPAPQSGPAAPNATAPAPIVAHWENPQLLMRPLPRSTFITGLPTVLPDGRLLLFTGREGHTTHTLLAYNFDPKTGILGDSQPLPADQWKVEGDDRYYAGGELGDPTPVFSPDGKHVAETLCTGASELGDVRDPAYIFDRDPATGRILVSRDPKTGRLAAKHHLVTEDDLQQAGLPARSYPVWRNISFSPDSRFVYVPVKTFYNVRAPQTWILQKQLDPNTGRYGSPRLIAPVGGWDIRSGVGVSNDGTFYLASGSSSNPADGLYILVNRFDNRPLRLRSWKDDEVILYVPRNPETGEAVGAAQVVKRLRSLRATRNYEHLAAGVYPWYYRAPAPIPNTNVWLFVVEVGGTHGGEMHLLTATEAYFKP